MEKKSVRRILLVLLSAGARLYASSAARVFIEIGTADFDTLAETFLEQREWTGISVEPKRAYLNRLPHREGYSFVHSLLCEQNGQGVLYSIDEDKIEKEEGDGGLPFWAKGLSSTQRLQWEVISQGWQSHWHGHSVPCTTYQTLLDAHQLDSENVSYVKVDTEGYDAKIVHMILEVAASAVRGLDKEPYPAVLEFEHCHLECLEHREVLASLEAAGYTCAKDFGIELGNYLCLHRDRGKDGVDSLPTHRNAVYDYRPPRDFLEEACRQTHAFNLLGEGDAHISHFRFPLGAAEEQTQDDAEFLALAHEALHEDHGLLRRDVSLVLPGGTKEPSGCGEDKECVGRFLLRHMRNVLGKRVAEMVHEFWWPVGDYLAQKQQWGGGGAGGGGGKNESGDSSDSLLLFAFVQNEEAMAGAARLHAAAAHWGVDVAFGCASERIEDTMLFVLGQSCLPLYQGTSSSTLSSPLSSLWALLLSVVAHERSVAVVPSGALLLAPDVPARLSHMLREARQEDKLVIQQEGEGLEQRECGAAADVVHLGGTTVSEVEDGGVVVYRPSPRTLTLLAKRLTRSLASATATATAQEDEGGDSGGTSEGDKAIVRRYAPGPDPCLLQSRDGASILWLCPAKQGGEVEVPVEHLALLERGVQERLKEYRSVPEACAGLYPGLIALQAAYQGRCELYMQRLSLRRDEKGAAVG